MKWSDIPRNPTNRTLRQFAAAWLVFFLIWAAVFGLAGGNSTAGTIFAVVAAIGGVAGLIHPPSLRWIFVAWVILVFPIGWVISQVVLLILYYGLFVPIGLLLRARGRDALGLKPSHGSVTFWRRKETPADVRRYFRQY